MGAPLHKKRKRQQRKRHRQNNRGVPILPDLYDSIDGNPTNRPYGYCHYHNGYMTKNQTVLHRCIGKHCRMFDYFADYQKKIHKDKWVQYGESRFRFNNTNISNNSNTVDPDQLPDYPLS